MKVLFLDCDGVLNTSDSWNTVYDADTTFSSHVMNLDLLSRLIDIIEDTGCKIVLSSTWRILDRGVPFLRKHGVEVYDVTDTDKGLRGDQIQRWLNKHPEVTKYAIVDDDGDMLVSQLPNFFQTELKHGLTEGIAYRITYKLNN